MVIDIETGTDKGRCRHRGRSRGRDKNRKKEPACACMRVFTVFSNRIVKEQGVSCEDL